MTAPRNCRNSATLLYKSISGAGERRRAAVRFRATVAPCQGSMTSIDQRRARPPPPNSPAATRRAGLAARARADRGRRWRCCRRFATFVVLADLTPIAPTHEVVVTLLADQRADRAAAARRHRAARSGWWCRRAGAAAPRARLHVRIVGAVLGHRRGARDPGRGGRERHARPRARPAVLDAHRGHDREFADRRRRLSARARADDPRRHHGDGVRRRARQAAVRSGARALPAVPHRPGDGARTCRPR